MYAQNLGAMILGGGKGTTRPFILCDINQATKKSTTKTNKKFMANVDTHTAIEFCTKYTKKTTVNCIAIDGLLQKLLFNWKHGNNDAAFSHHSNQQQSNHHLQERNGRGIFSCKINSFCSMRMLVVECFYGFGDA